MRRDLLNILITSPNKLSLKINNKSNTAKITATKIVKKKQLSFFKIVSDRNRDNKMIIN